MTKILDRLSSPQDRFHPQTAKEFFALQLARKLGALDRVGHFVLLVDQYSQGTLLRIYRRARKTQQGTTGLADRFEAELAHINHKEEGNDSQVSRHQG
ncbi:MAG TPA: hypothetical protein VGK99_15350 [Acidobacteriota bacterium]|jgi:hypothetical protein